MTIHDPNCPLCEGTNWKPVGTEGTTFAKCDHTYLIIGKHVLTGWTATIVFASIVFGIAGVIGTAAYLVFT